ncbi:hypothetical protein SCACP_33070 [Sporomusa carbonis]|uniref:ATP synthase subunit I n=1 Tax=Sporomusa carbonis TaxID=3076075 RepID=UPI003A77502B
MRKSVLLNDDYAARVRRTLIYLLAWGLLVTLSAVLSGKIFIVPGLLLGWSGSLIYFLLMCRRVKKSADLPPGQAVASMRAGWLLRFGFIIAILVLSIQVPGIDFWAAVVGLFSLHIILMLDAVYIVVAGLIANSNNPKINSGKE